MLSVQTFVIVGGVTKMIPLTGVTLPFVSAGGSSLISCMILIGILLGIESINRQERAIARRK
jgi:cell division protein FtsW (lipid II flippase)